MAEKKPSEVVRINLERRDENALSKRKKKSPSQKRSENAVIKERKRAGRHDESCKKAASDLVFDCFTCPKSPCDNSPVACEMVMILERCAKCGTPIRHYRDTGTPWVYCQKCREGFK